MLRAASFAVVVALSVLAGCPAPVETICGQSTALPDVTAGFGEATRSDGDPFKKEGTWKPSATVLVGSLDMIIANDDQGLVVEDLIADGAFPICVLQGARSETSGQANLVDVGFVTDATHDGGLVILGKEGDNLIGRFSFDLVSPDGATTLTFSDGVFNVPLRQ